MENVGLFYDHLVYFTAIGNILWPFGMLYVPRKSGKSGNNQFGAPLPLFIIIVSDLRCVCFASERASGEAAFKANNNRASNGTTWHRLAV
jgi:hypothetical protein